MTVPGNVKLVRHVADIDDDGHHTGSVGGAGEGELLIADTHSTPIVFADLITTEADDDLLYAD
jgi:hypothetical protein